MVWTLSFNDALASLNLLLDALIVRGRNIVLATFFNPFTVRDVLLPVPLSGVLRTQKLKSPLLRTQS